MSSIGAVVAGAVAVGLVLPVFAANPLSSSEIKARFATGETISGTLIPGGAAYELTLNADGAATMKPSRGDKEPRTGTWRLSDSGYCTQWDAGTERCFTIVRNGKAYDVVDGTGKVVARWTT